MKPTAEQLKDEIVNGPLKDDLAGAWADVFPTETNPNLSSAHPVQQRWERIRFRFGKLTADAIDKITKVLNDSKLRSKVFPMTVATFAKFLAGRGLLRKIKAAITDYTNADPVREGQIKDICDLVVTLTQSAPDRVIDSESTEEAGMIQALVLAGIVSVQDVAAFRVAASAPCSRLTELGWEISVELLNEARELS